MAKMASNSNSNSNSNPYSICNGVLKLQLILPLLLNPWLTLSFSTRTSLTHSMSPKLYHESRIAFGTSQCNESIMKTSTEMKNSRMDDNDLNSMEEQKRLFQSTNRNSQTRRNVLHSLPYNLLLFGGMSSFNPKMSNRANAAESSSKDTIYITGKAPKVPGQQAKDKNDLSGTKKDPKFLRSIAECKGQCDRTPAADGLAKSKEDCLSECQDICCTTYEQCTFAIVPRL